MATEIHPCIYKYIISGQKAKKLCLFIFQLPLAKFLISLQIDYATNEKVLITTFEQSKNTYP